MTIRSGSIQIGNAPCSWGVEFADDARNPPWERVLQECAEAGFTGIELGPVGYMPEDPILLREKFQQYSLTLIGGVIFRPFHDKNQWDTVLDGAVRTMKALKANDAKHLVLIDSIAPDRALTAGRPDEAPQFDKSEWRDYVTRIFTIAKMGYEEYGLIPAIHPHAGGYMDFLPEIERLLDETDETILKICPDTGHCIYAGFDPLPFMQKHMGRISYVHFKDINPQVKANVVANQIGFYDACAQGVFCNLGQGAVDFTAVKKLLDDVGFSGWCTIEQDCDPAGDTNPKDDAKLNRDYLASLGF
ncbi:MAG: sugar phosphate isomerase/epimerase [Alphaproteobacteria bacterium]|nr:sugar phosphate isomerase/epimerase [Alphaproteobacteria bacterium]